MKEIGIGALLGVFIAAAAPAAPLKNQPASFVTRKSTGEFASCFVRTQDRRTIPWWFVPKADGGGTFSNLGANSAPGAYFVVIADRGPRREIRIEDRLSAHPVAQAVSQCI